MHLRRNQNIGTNARFALVVRASYYTTAIYCTKRAAQRPVAWNEFLLNDTWCEHCSMLGRCSPCCLVRAVCCVLSSCGVAETDRENPCGWKKRRTSLHGTCEVLGCQKQIAWLFASFRDFEPPEHVPRTSVRAYTCAAGFTAASCLPRSRERENRPPGGRAKNFDVQETSFSYIVVQGSSSRSGVFPAGWRKQACYQGQRSIDIQRYRTMRAIPNERNV